MMQVKYKYISIRRIYQDVRSGIVRYSTRGSLDIVTFDSNKEVIPFISKHFDVLTMNKGRLNDIELALKHDGIFDTFKKTLVKSYEILNRQPDTFRMHTDVRGLLWREMQCHPLYNRSISSTFIEYQDPFISTNRYSVYKSKFISLLEDKKYDPNNIGDRKKIFYAMLRSYRELDPDISKKFDYFKDVNITIDQEFLYVLSELIKKALI